MLQECPMYDTIRNSFMGGVLKSSIIREQALF